MYNEEINEEEQEVKNSSGLANFYHNNKILIWIFGGIILFILLMTLLTKGGSNSSDSIEYKLSIKETEKDIVALGTSLNLEAEVTNDPQAAITWTSSDENIATVDKGNVKGVGYGKATIMATYIQADGEKQTDKKEITVADGDPNVELIDVSFKDGDLFMPPYETYKIALVPNPSDAYITNKKFTSSDENVVTVDETGAVTAVSEGEATIFLDVNDGVFKKELRVYVNKNQTKMEIIVTPTTISFVGELQKIKVGTTEKLAYTLDPVDADSEKLIWTSSDEDIVTVNESGRIKGIKEGHATVTLSSVNGIKDEIDIEVENDIIDITDINLSMDTVYLQVGQTQTIVPSVSPDNASNKALSFAPADTGIVAVQPNEAGTGATIMGISSGTTFVVIKSTTGNIVEKKIDVIVSDPTGGSNNSGGSSDGSGSSGGSSSQGFKISSLDANGGRFVEASYNKIKDNGATGPVTVTLEITDSNVSSLLVTLCEYSTSCSTSIAQYTINGTDSFVINDVGEYIIRVTELDSNGDQIREKDKFLWIKDTTGSSTTSPSSNAPTITCPDVQVGLRVTCTVKNGYLQGGVTVKDSSVAKIHSTSSSSFVVEGKSAGTTKLTGMVNGQVTETTIKVKSKSTSACDYNSKADCEKAYNGKTCWQKSGCYVLKECSDYSNSTCPSYCYKTSSGCSDTNSSSSPKAMSSLNYSCLGQTLIIKDGSTQLTTSTYCTSTTSGDTVTYICNGSGNYTGTYTYSCTRNTTSKNIKNITQATVSLKKNVIDYSDGMVCLSTYKEEVRELIEVSIGSKVLKENVDYEIIEASWNMRPKEVNELCGKKNIQLCVGFTVSGIGSYTGLKRVSSAGTDSKVTDDDTYCVTIK